MKFGGLICLIAVLVMVNLADADIANFEDLTLPPESYWNGSDASGGFVSGNAYFNNNYDATWGAWDGWAYSNMTDTTTPGYVNQYSAIAGGGYNSSNYGLSSIALDWKSGTYDPIPTSLTFIKTTTGYRVAGAYFTNTTYAYWAMKNGEGPAKKFGGTTGDDPDWFLLTITGKDNAGVSTGTVDFYLADYRFADNSQDYIVNTWEYVDLTSLGLVKSLEFSLSSSDVGAWGMNTPAYFAIDTIVSESAFVRVGPYTEAGVNGYIGRDYRHATPTDDDVVINPIFHGWATSVVSYSPAPGVDSQWSDPNKALGPATGDYEDIVSLGDLDRQQIDAGLPPGQITLSFSDAIRDVNGYDFAVFENALISQLDTAAGSVAGQMFAELGYVEVSSNGEDFVRFPTVSLTRAPVGPYGTIEISNIYNLAGKHPNANGLCTGTPFDLQEIADRPNVISGVVDINNIKYLRIVDIPGSGDFYDQATAHIDPATQPYLGHYTNNHPIYDAWVTFGSGGLDLEAVGVLQEQNYSADINLDGVVDIFDFALFASAWRSHFGQADWIVRCDLAQPQDYIIDTEDFAVFATQWLKVEKWRR